MGLKVEVDSIDKVDEAHRGLYVQTDTGYRLDADFEDVSGLKSALHKERQAAREAQKNLKKYEGVDLEHYEELNTMAEEKFSGDKHFQRAKTKWQKEKSQLSEAVTEREAKIP